MKDTFFYSKKTLNANGKIIDLSVPCVMGILNVTPDSFFDGGKYSSDKSILERVERMIVEGARIIDVGGYSSRPNAIDISIEEELSRVVPTIKKIRELSPDIIISIDTFRSEVAKKSIEAGADMINDISGGTLDPLMFDTVSELKVPYILMHMRGTPQTMIGLSQYQNMIEEILEYFLQKINQLEKLGVTEIVIDPGLGFAKTIQQNYELIQKLPYFNSLNFPILVGVSRKSMIYKTLSVGPEDTLNGTTVLNTIALMNGASILRVHDVKECVDAVKLFKSVYP